MWNMIFYVQWGKEGASNLVSLLSKSLEPEVDMHNNDRVICSCVNTMFLEDYSLFYQVETVVFGVGINLVIHHEFLSSNPSA